MENHTPTSTPTAAERYTTIRERVCARLEAEGARYGIGRMVDLLLLELLTWMIAWCVNRDEQRLQEQACQNDIVSDDADFAGCGPAGGDAGDERGGDERGGDARGRTGRARAVVRGIAPVDPVAAGESCVSGAREACGRRHVAANLAAMGRSVSASDDGGRIFAGLFAKTELRN